MPVNILKYNKDTADNAEAAVTITAGQLVGLNSSGKLVLADGDAATPIPAVGIAITGGAAGDQVTYVEDAKIEDTSLSLTPGAKLYTSGTAGGITATPLATAGNLVQVVGYAITATRIRVRVTPSWTVVQAAGTSTVAFG